MTKTEYISLPFRCSVTGKTFEARFQKQDDTFNFFTSIKVDDDISGMNDTQAVKQSNGLIVDDDKLRSNGFFCPYCRCRGLRNSIYMRCGQCREYVCLGNSRDLGPAKTGLEVKWHSAGGSRSEVLDNSRNFRKHHGVTPTSISESSGSSSPLLQSQQSSHPKKQVEPSSASNTSVVLYTPSNISKLEGR